MFESVWFWTSRFMFNSRNVEVSSIVKAILTCRCKQADKLDNWNGTRYVTIYWYCGYNLYTWVCL